MQFNEQLSWIDSSGPNSDVVISCRARLARNVAGFNFVSRAADTEARQLSIMLRDVLLDPELSTDMLWVSVITTVARRVTQRCTGASSHQRGTSSSRMRP